jgi:hypothetical protein
MTTTKPAMEAKAMENTKGHWEAVVRHRGPDCRQYLDQHLPGHYQHAQEAQEAAAAFIRLVQRPATARRAS